MNKHKMNKKAQDKKSKIFSLCHNKMAQEEMVGFALIMIIVSVILIIFISLTITKPQEEVESYEVESFIQAMLQYTTDCEDNLEHLSVQRLILRCKRGDICLDERNTCDVLDETLNGLIKGSWQIENRPVKGYDFKVISDQETIIAISEGNKTNNFKGSVQILPNDIDISFRVYY